MGKRRVCGQRRMSVDGDDELVRVGAQCHSPHALMSHEELVMTCCTRKVQNMSVVTLGPLDPSQKPVASGGRPPPRRSWVN